jgi:hypothetical protein
MNYALGCAFNL